MRCVFGGVLAGACLMGVELVIRECGDGLNNCEGKKKI